MCSSWNLVAAQTICSSSALEDFAQTCQTTSAAVATAGHSCNQGRAKRLGGAGEAPRSLRQSSVLHKVSLRRMLAVTTHPFERTALYTECTA